MRSCEGPVGCCLLSWRTAIHPPFSWSRLLALSFVRMSDIKSNESQCFVNKFEAGSVLLTMCCQILLHSRFWCSRLVTIDYTSKLIPQMFPLHCGRWWKTQRCFGLVFKVTKNDLWGISNGIMQNSTSSCCFWSSWSLNEILLGLIQKEAQRRMHSRGDHGRSKEWFPNS